MLINRLRLIESIQASSYKDRFKDLITVLRKHQLKDLLLTNVLLEAQTFKVLPFALHSASGEDELSPESETQAMMAWVIASHDELQESKRRQEGNNSNCMDRQYLKSNDADELDSCFFTRLSSGEPCTDCASEVVEQLLNKICGSVRVKEEVISIAENPKRKSAFYHFCKKLDNAISLAKPREEMLYN